MSSLVGGSGLSESVSPVDGKEIPVEVTHAEKGGSQGGAHKKVKIYFQEICNLLYDDSLDAVRDHLEIRNKHKTLNICDNIQRSQGLLPGDFTQIR